MTSSAAFRRQSPSGGKMKLKWRRYPAGADILLFGGALQLSIVRDGENWAAVVYPDISAGGGALYIGTGLDTIDSAIEVIESWLMRHIKEGLPATPRGDYTNYSARISDGRQSRRDHE